jgi:phosphoribosylanthranilate isomerase
VTVAVKICGLRSAADVAAAVKAGVSFIGFVIFPPSPRALTPEAAAGLIAALPSGVTAVALLVDPDDALVERALAARPGLIQLHGRESPERVAQIRGRSRLPVMKAVGVARGEDLAAARR